MDDRFKIYVERLKEEGPEKLEEALPPSFIDVDEEELSFEAPVHLTGQAFVTDDALVIDAVLKTKAKVPCSICNEFCEVEITVDSLSHMERVCEVKGGVYDLAPLLREALLLELPPKAECGGQCPGRENLKKYLSKGEEHFPFEKLGEE